jgi:MerR family transcriptional regulator, copper efflux regulator
MKIGMTTLTIGQAAQKASVGVETIRFYERKGLIVQPQKPASRGFRTYSREIIQRIRFIRQAQELGFSLKEIDVLLGLRADPGNDCAMVQLRAQQKLAEVERKMAQLQKIGSALKEVIAACPSQGGLDGCSIMAALEQNTENSG